MRPARVSDDAAVGLLYESAAPYYDVYAGSESAARRMLAGMWPRPGHTASWDVCHVAELDGRIVGAMVAFPSTAGDELARHFLRLSVPRLPMWRWPFVARHLRASAVVSPVPPPDALYVDALAVAEDMRRRGIAKVLLRRAEELAAEHDLSGVALDTGLQNAAARALYASYGFDERQIRRAPNEKLARAVGGPGFVSFFKARG